MDKRNKLQEELNDLRKQAQARKVVWDTYTLQFPLLLEIKTEEDFYALQRVNTSLPDDAWKNLTEYQQYTQKAKDLEQQISQIKPIEEDEDEDDDDEDEDEEGEEKADVKDNVPENQTDEKTEDPTTTSNVPSTNEIVSPDEKQDLQIPDEEGVETPIPQDYENSIQNGQQRLNTENSDSDETLINIPQNDSLAEGMDADPRYLEIEDELKAKWQQENPNEENLSSNHQNYLLGAQDQNNANLPTLKNDAETLFKQRYPTDAKKYQAKERVRVYKNPNIDPAVIQASENILRATNLDLEVRNATKITGTASNENIWQKVHLREQLFGWDKFAREYPEKARAYAESGHQELRQAIERIEKSKENTIQADSQKNLTSENNQNESSAVSEIESLEPTQIETITEEETVTENPSIETETTEEENYPIHRPAPQTQMPQYNPQASRPVPIQQNNSTFGRFSRPQRSSNRFDVSNGVNKARRAKNRILGSSARKYLKLINTITNVIPQARIAKYVVFIVLIFIMFIVIAISGDSQLTSYDDYTQSDNSVTLPPGTDPNTPTLNPIPGLILEKSVGATVNNGEEILYTIRAIYGGSLDVTIHDKIPENTEYLSASGEKTVDNASGVVSWRLGANTPTRTNESADQDIYTFTLTVRPTQDDIEVENYAYATAPGGTTGPAPDTTDFVTLMTGQGRNTQVLGNEDNFVNTATNNFSQFRDNSTTYEPYLRDIHRISLSYNINPAIVLTIWGVEQSFGIVNGLEFGCDINNAASHGFANQVDCALRRTLNVHMNHYDQILAEQGGQPPVYYQLGGPACPYWDSFIYAYEAYTPVCSMNHGNDDARSNFVAIYKQLLYGVQ